MGVAGERGPKGRKIWRTESSARLQTADLGKGQWFAAGFMGKLLKSDNMYPVRFAKDSFEKSLVSGFRGVWCLRSQAYSRTRMRPSSSGTSGAFHVEV